jgi:catechol 2,3-dioxygenase-like lactoylglutathione lyase family enzyme
MLSDCRLGAFVATANPEKARAFYEGVLGLRVLSEDPFAIVFDGNGTTLRMQKVGTVTLVPYTTLGWGVPDIGGMVRALAKSGVVFERYKGMEQDELGIWVAPGGHARVAWFKDPDGNLLSLTQGG